MDYWKKSHRWTLLGSRNSTVTASHLGKLSFCRNHFHLEDLQQMERPLALLACLCLLVFRWTRHHPETSRTVSLLLSHFCSLGLRNAESQAWGWDCSHVSCSAYFVWMVAFGGAERAGAEMPREEAESDLTRVVSQGAVWTEAVLLFWCQANLLWHLIVGDVGKHIPYEMGD